MFARAGSVNIKVSAFQDHNMSIENKKLEWDANQGEKVMKKFIEKTIIACDDALITIFRSVYFLAKEIVLLTKFPSLCKLLLNLSPILLKVFTMMKSHVLKWCFVFQM